MLVMPSVAHTIGRATRSLRHRSCRLLGVLSVGHPLPVLSVVPPVGCTVGGPPVARTVGRAACCLCCLLPALPVAHAVSHHLPGAPSVMPLIARAVGCTTCCAIGRATCCAISHTTCCTVGRAACCSTCHVRCRSCHLSRHSSPVLPVVPSVVLPVAPPVACAVCRATHSLLGSLRCLLPMPHVALPVGCAVGQPPIARAVGRAATCRT